MPLPPRAVTALSLCVFFSQAAQAEELQCKLEQRFRDGGSRGVELELKVEDGRIKDLSYSNFIASGKEGGGYVCSVDTQDKSDIKKRWIVKGSITTLDLKSTSGDEHSQMQIRQLPNGYRLNFDNMSQYYCGFGASYPKTVRLQKGDKRCHVQFETP